MKTIHLFSTLLFLFMSTHISAQNLNHHRWENRLILILTNDTSAPEYQKQIDEFKSQQKGMDERKLMVYHITPNQYRTGLKENNNWKKSTDLYSQFNKGKKDFEVILIGLDGGIKLRQDELLTCQKLFSTIDVMPMRRAEMRNKN